MDKRFLGPADLQRMAKDHHGGTPGEAGTIALMAVSFVLSFAASRLLAKKNKSLFQDDKPTTTSTRGSILPRVFGTARLGPVVGWVGNREKRGDDTYEDGWHLLTLGPNVAFGTHGANPKTYLHRVWESGKIIYDGPIDPSTASSHTTSIPTSNGSMTIHWGEFDQPLNAFLANVIGINSRWPYFAGVVWDDKKITPGQWPLVDYEFEYVPSGIILPNDQTYVIRQPESHDVSNNSWAINRVQTNPAGSAWISVVGNQEKFLPRNDKVRIAGSGVIGVDGDYTIDSTQYPYAGLQNAIVTRINLKETLPGPWAGGTGTATVLTRNYDSGVNPAYVLDELMFAEWPHGMGLPQDKFDATSLRALAGWANEAMPRANLLLQDGLSHSRAIAQIMEDLDLMIPWEPGSGKYAFRLVREPLPDANPHLGHHHLAEPLPNIKKKHFDPRQSDKSVYVFTNRRINHRDSTVLVGADGRARLADRSNFKKIPIHIARDAVTARLIAERRSQADLTTPVRYRIKGTRATRYFYPGFAFSCEDVPELMRVTEVQPHPKDGTTTITALQDKYGVPVSSQTASFSEGVQSISLPEPDLLFVIYELPYLLSTSIAAWIPRIRASKEHSGARVWWNLTPGLPPFTGPWRDGGLTSGICAGGTLNTDIGAGDSYAQDEGPEITLLGDDIDEMPDLTSDTEKWLNGNFLALINAEIFFVQAITILSPTTARLDGVRRAKYASSRQAHGSGNAVFLFDPSEVFVLADPLFAGLGTLGVYPTPILRGSELQLNPDYALNGPLQGLAIRAPAPINVRVVGTQNLTYKRNHGITLTWNYFTRTARTNRQGAGSQFYGEVVTTTKPDPDGTFTVLLYDAVFTLKRTIENVATNEVVISFDDLIDIYGEEPDTIIVEVYGAKNGLLSVSPATVTINKAKTEFAPPLVGIPEHLNRDTFIFLDDFAPMRRGWQGESVSGGVMAVDEGEDDHPGILRLNAGPSGSSTQDFWMPPDDLISLQPGLRLEATCRVVGLSDRHYATVGLGDFKQIAVAPDNSVYIVFDPASSANWRCVTRIADVPSVIDSGVAVVDNTWVNLRIEIATEFIVGPATPTLVARFYIDDVWVGTSTSLPTVKQTLFFNQSIHVAANQRFDMDRIAVSNTLLAR